MPTIHVKEETKVRIANALEYGQTPDDLISRLLDIWLALPDEKRVITTKGIL